MTRPTKRPWRRDPHDERSIICPWGGKIAALPQSGYPVARLRGEAEANAELIVRAVNSHDALVEALQQFVSIALTECDDDAEWEERIGEAQAALDLAQAKDPDQ